MYRIYVVLSAAVIISFATSIEAAPLLLVEMNYQTLRYGGEGDPPVRDWEYGFSAYPSFDGPPLFEWFDVYGVDDIGKTFPAPDDVVDGAAFALASSSTYYYMTTAGSATPSATERLSDMEQPPGPCNAHLCARLFVADPTTYRVTVLERLIDDLFAVRPTGSGSWIVGGNQVVRFWGEPIPEPRPVQLVLIALIACFLWRPIRCGLSSPAGTNECR
jgi:hypothetical protein